MDSFFLKYVIHDIVRIYLFRILQSRAFLNKYASGWAKKCIIHREKGSAIFRWIYKDFLKQASHNQESKRQKFQKMRFFIARIENVNDEVQVSLANILKSICNSRTRGVYGFFFVENMIISIKILRNWRETKIKKTNSGFRQTFHFREKLCSKTTRHKWKM